MATDTKITGLTSYPAPQANDVIAIVDVATGLLKKIRTTDYLAQLTSQVAVLNLADTNFDAAMSALTARVASLEYITPTAANYPALRHLFLFNEATGGTSLTDSVGGVVFTGAIPISITNNADGTINWSMTPDSMSGSWAIPGSKKIVMILCGKPAANSTVTLGQAAIGASALKGFKLGTGTVAANRSAYTDGTTGVAGPTVGIRAANGAAATYAVSIDIAAGATGFKAYDYDGITYHDATTATAITPTTLVGEAALTTALSALVAGSQFNSAMRPAMLAVFYFDAVPADMAYAVQYMHNAALNAPYNKLLPPSWVGVV